MSYFKMSKKEYCEYVKQRSPNSKLLKNMLKAFLVGGLICCVGQGLLQGYEALGASEEHSATFTTITLIFIGALLTGLGIYDNIALFAGAGTLVPITGFSNAVVSPALEFKPEGFVAGTGAKMFSISGPVIVYGVATSVVYGLIYWLVGLII